MSAERKLNARLVRQMLRGYRRMNEFTQAEERTWAARLTEKESRKIFEELYSVWEKMGACAGGNWQAVERLRLAESLKTQRLFAQAARRLRMTQKR